MEVESKSQSRSRAGIEENTGLITGLHVKSRQMDKIFLNIWRILESWETPLSRPFVGK